MDASSSPSRRSAGTTPYTGGNQLIDALPAGDRASLVELLQVVTLETPFQVLDEGGGIDDVYFPIDAILSVTANLRDGDAYEVGLIGNGQASGAELAFGVRSAYRSVLTQIEGRTARISAEAFLHAVDRSAALAFAVRRSVLSQLYFSQQLVACNFVHAPVQRAARWLLMVRDLTGRDDFFLRDEFLEMMLNRRDSNAGVKTMLAQAGGVAWDGEHVRIGNVARLRGEACECYETARAAADR